MIAIGAASSPVPLGTCEQQRRAWSKYGLLWLLRGRAAGVAAAAWAPETPFSTDGLPPLLVSAALRQQRAASQALP